MLLVVHIVLALASLGLMVLALGLKWRHSQNHSQLVKLSGMSFAGLFLTGLIMIIRYHANIMSTCLSGMFYLALLAVVYVIYRKLPVGN